MLMKLRRALIGSSLLFGLPLVLLGCPKKAPAVDADAGPPQPVVVDAAPTELKPLDDLDAGADADANEAGPVKHGTGLTTSQTRVKQCCNAMRAQAKSLGTSPEAAQLAALAVQCDALALQVGPSKGPQAPELEPLRQLLKGKPTLPPLCNGL
jgi:hypothetical protein